MKKMSELFSEMLHNDKQPMYVAVRPDPSAISYFAKITDQYNVPNIHSRDKLHCTLIYSRKPTIIPQCQQHRIYKSSLSKFDVFNTRDGKRCLVAKLMSADLQCRHNELMTELDASYDFPDYLPHVSLSYDIGNFDHTILNNSLSYYPIYFTQEYYEILDDIS